MIASEINALSTAIIAFVTVLGAMFGFYYNLKSSAILLSTILFFELLFVITVLLFISWIRGEMKT